MKINEILSEAWVDLPPEEKAREKQKADNEFRALKGIDSPESQALANEFRNAFNITGTVDSAYELARSKIRKSNATKTKKDKEDFDKMSSRLGFQSAQDQGVNDTSKSALDPVLPSTDSGGGRGQYTQYKDGTDRASGSSGNDWAKNTFGKSYVAQKLGKAVNKVKNTEPVKAITRTKDNMKGAYNFVRDRNSNAGTWDKFKRAGYKSS